MVQGGGRWGEAGGSTGGSTGAIMQRDGPPLCPMHRQPCKVSRISMGEAHNSSAITPYTASTCNVCKVGQNSKQD